MTYPITPLSRPRRLKERASNEQEAIHALIDQVPLGHVAYCWEQQVLSTPTLVWREGNLLWWHGSRASRMMAAVCDGLVCVSFADVQALVLAKSAFHHSINYRSVMAWGHPRWLEQSAAKEHALRALVEKLYPERWEQLRPMSKQELAATAVVEMEIEQASFKQRQGPPKDDDEDLTWPVWTGLAQLQTSKHTLSADAHAVGNPPAVVWPHPVLA